MRRLFARAAVVKSKALAHHLGISRKMLKRVESVDASRSGWEGEHARTNMPVHIALMYFTKAVN